MSADDIQRKSALVRKESKHRRPDGTADMSLEEHAAHALDKMKLDNDEPADPNDPLIHGADPDHDEAMENFLQEEDTTDDHALDEDDSFIQDDSGARNLLTQRLGIFRRRKGGWFKAVFARRRRQPCKWHSWKGWGACNMACNWGKKFRSRWYSAAAHGGSACHGPLTQETKCLNKYCPVTCVWNEWQNFPADRKCPVACNGGKLGKIRTKKAAAAWGGRPCDDDNLFAIWLPCNTQPCPINCNYNSWTPFTDCTLSCGVGMQQRTRTTPHTGAYGGSRSCHHLLEARQCNLHACPIDCGVGEWEEWGPCRDQTCNPKTLGQMSRYRALLVPDQHGGKECPKLQEWKECEEPCPTEAPPPEDDGMFGFR